MKTINIPIINKSEFRKLLLDHLVKSEHNNDIVDVLDSILDKGMSRLNFDDLGESLKDKFVYLPTVIVDTGDSKFLWVVCSNKAIIIDKQFIYKNDENH